MAFIKNTKKLTNWWQLYHTSRQLFHLLKESAIAQNILGGFQFENCIQIQRLPFWVFSMAENIHPLRINSIFKDCIFNDLYTQHRTWIYNPKIKGLMLHQWSSQEPLKHFLKSLEHPVISERKKKLWRNIRVVSKRHESPSGGTPTGQRCVHLCIKKGNCIGMKHSKCV